MADKGLHRRLESIESAVQASAGIAVVYTHDWAPEEAERLIAEKRAEIGPHALLIVVEYQERASRPGRSRDGL